MKRSEERISLKRFCESPLHGYEITPEIIASSTSSFFLPEEQLHGARSITLSKGRIAALMKGKKILQATGCEDHERSVCINTPESKYEINSLRPLFLSQTLSGAQINKSTCYLRFIPPPSNVFSALLSFSPPMK